MSTTSRAPQVGILLAIALLASCARGAGGSRPLSNGGGGKPIDPPDSIEAPPLLAGLAAVAAGTGSARLDWFAPGTGHEVAVFSGASRSTVYGGAPIHVPAASERSVVLTGLTDGVEIFFGLGIRPVGGSTYTPIGLVLSARPGAPIYVDAAADPTGADGNSPATAFPNLRAGLLNAFVRGGANVWVKEGTFADGFVPLFPGTYLCGGFTDTFSLDDREPFGRGTVLVVSAGSSGFGVSPNDENSVLDGWLLDGDGVATIGIDVDSADVELRALEVRDFTSRGIRLRNTSSDDVKVRMSALDVHGCLADGVSGNGPFDLSVDGSRFASNVQEGIDLDDLVARDGGASALRISGSVFVGNGAEGVDVDLVASSTTQTVGGTFDVDVRGSRFELNGADGLLVDLDYEFAPLWSSTVAIRECVARANLGSGILLDADGRGSFLLHGNRALGNGADGIQVSSESQTGLAVCSASVLVGNGGAGLRATLGNVPVLGSHLLLAGNVDGGFVSSTVESAATSCIAYLQDTPFFGVFERANVVLTDPFANEFENAAEAFTRVVAIAGDELTLADGGVARVGALAELAGDEIERDIDAAAATSAKIDPAPSVLLLPALFALYPAGAGVVADYRLIPGSTASAAGMAAPGAPVVDAGPWGAPDATFPGVPQGGARELFVPVLATPALTVGVDDGESLRIDFSSALASSSLVPGSVRALGSGGGELAVALRESGGALFVDPPAGGWNVSSFALELHRDLASVSGATLAAPVAIRVSVR